MDKQLRYNIDIRLNDGASQGTEALNSRLAKLSSWTKAINAETQKLGTQFSTVSKSASNIFAQTNLSASQLRQNFQQISNTSTTAAAGMNQVANVAPRFNALNVSVQQVARELPSLAISANTFFLAISNNLPILADSISAARKENEAMIASGQKATPVWKQVASSLFSWQTALVLGVTALSMYATDIVAAISSQSSFKKSVDSTALAMKQLNSAREKGVQDAQQELTSLNVLYSASMDDARSKEERLSAVKQLKAEYPDYFKNLSNESIMAGQASEAYDRLAKSLTDAAIARASMDKMTENATKILDLRDQEKELTKELENAQNWLSQFQKSTIQTQADSQSFAYAASKVTTLKNSLQSVRDEIIALNTANKELSSNINVSSLLGGKQGSSKEVNKNLETIGGITNKINELKEAQSKAFGQQQIDLEKEIQLWQEKLNLMQRAIVQGAMGNLGDDQYKDLLQSEVKTVDTPAKIKIPVEFDQDTLKRSFRIMQVQFSDSIKELEITGEQISGILTGSIQSFAQNFGQALASGDGIEVFKSLLISVMDMLQQFGAALIAAGVATEAFKSLFANPIAGIIAGTALIATAAAAKAALQNATAFADGGIVSGPTYALVGEYSGASNNPEVIAPLNKLKSMIEPAQSDSGMSGEVRFVIKGETLEGILSKMNRKRNRTR
jgi:hypothetical protein